MEEIYGTIVFNRCFISNLLDINNVSKDTSMFIKSIIYE